MPEFPWEPHLHPDERPFARRADRIPAEAFRPPEGAWREERLTVPFLRLDALLRSLLRLSRTEAADRIRLGTVQVNWAPAEDADREVAEGDVLSVRGWGRFKILGIEEQSRRGRIVVRVGRTW
ncbi:MAG: S4 domain-containing protein [Alicyclobacillaceae bacterium]|nr:S4 domain-containing protein [Alicyclobacillaceae bacterium]